MICWEKIYRFLFTTEVYPYRLIIPRSSMYGIVTYIYPINDPVM